MTTKTFNEYLRYSIGFSLYKHCGEKMTKDQIENEITNRVDNLSNSELINYIDEWFLENKQ